MFKMNFLNQEDFHADFNPRTSMYFDAELNVLYPASNGLPDGGEIGSILIKLSQKDYDAGWILPADQVEAGNNTPVTSSAVYISILNAVNTIMQTCAPVYYDTEENWNADRTIIAERRAIYVYSNHSYVEDGQGNRYPVPAIKIGDGTSYLISMPFINDKLELELANHINNHIIHITQEEREFWNNKVTCYKTDQDNELLIFTKNNILNNGG